MLSPFEVLEADPAPPWDADIQASRSSTRRKALVIEAATSQRRVVDVATADAWCSEYHRTRDPRLRDDIVAVHHWLVAVCARRMVRRRELLADLAQVGNVGLLNAIERFDPAFDVSFHTYASATILGELRRHYRTVWQLRVPRSLQERYVLVKQGIDELTATLRRSPQPDEIATYLNLPIASVLEAVSVGSAMTVGSLSAASAPDGMASPAPQLAVTDGAFEHTNEHLTVIALMETLPALERTAIFLSFFEEMKQSEIGERLGMSQVQVSRLIRRAIEKLRGSFDSPDRLAIAR